MKNYKGLKLTLIILVIILLAMISFGGIFVQTKGNIVNILPEYILARDLKGYRMVELNVSDEVKETIKYDAEGNVISENDTETEVAKTEEVKVNSAEILTEENYINSKSILEKRLKDMGEYDYIIRQNKNNGTIILELKEDSNTDRIVGQLPYQGKFEIVDNDTNEVLLTNNDIKSVKAGYGTNSNGTASVVINFQFNDEGTEKFKNITNTYIETTTTVPAEEEGGEDKTETVTKEIALKIDDSTLLTTHFDEEISNGLLQLSVGSSITTQEDLQDYLIEASNISSLINSGKMPIAYQIEQNQYIFSNITAQYIAIVISVGIAIVTIGMIYLIIKYKEKGILSSISLIGYIAILLIAIRYFNVEVSIGGLISIALSIVINYFILVNILKEKDVIKVLKKSVVVLIPTIIIAIVFTFMNITMGAPLFWEIVISLLYNLSVTNIMLKD